MAVKPGMIENRESDQTVENRAVSGGHAEKATAEEQLHALRAKIKAGQNYVGTDPRPKGAPVCQDCFQRGWIAAMQSLEKG
jgi:hypothetical protein